MPESTLEAWHAFFTDRPPARMPPPILQSWERCRHAGLARQPEEPLFRRVCDAELDRRLDASQALRTAAQPHIEWLSDCFSDVAHAVYVTDADGIVLDAAGRWPGGLAALGLDPGCDWSEATMGTNGAGTALKADQPVAVVGAEHYSLAFQRCTCTGAPIHDAAGGVIGAIDLSTFPEDARPGQLLLISYVAYVIEQALKAERAIGEAESVRLMARLSSFTAHELVSPLSSMTAAADLLQRLDLPPEAQRLVERLQRSSRRLGATVEDMRTLGGAPGGEAFGPADPVALAQAVLAEAQARGIRTSLHAPLPPPAVVCHQGLLVRALENLVRNACEAMPEGGTVGVAITTQAGAVELEVWDDGPGIPPERREALLQCAFTTKAAGSGLGLLLVRTIVERVHGGSLSYRPNHPRGSCFKLRLPGTH